MGEENIPTAAWDHGKLPSIDSLRRLPPREREAYNAALGEWLDEHDIQFAHEAWVIGDTVHAHVYLTDEDGNRYRLGEGGPIATGTVDRPLLRRPPSPLG